MVDIPTIHHGRISIYYFIIILPQQIGHLSEEMVDYVLDTEFQLE